MKHEAKGQRGWRGPPLLYGLEGWGSRRRGGGGGSDRREVYSLSPHSRPALPLPTPPSALLPPPRPRTRCHPSDPKCSSVIIRSRCAFTAALPGYSLFTASTSTGRCLLHATMAPPTGTMKFLSVL
jgi:hypothetical protein